MPPSLAEDIIFVVFFFSLFTILLTLVPYLYDFCGINKNDDMLIVLLWLGVFIIMAILLKTLQNERYKSELEDVEDIFSNNIDGFDL